MAPSVTLRGCVAVAAAAPLGDALRVLLALWSTYIPLVSNDGYVFANMIGCFVIGVCRGLPCLATTLPLTNTLLTVGFCGSLTTFSTWIVAIVTSASAADGAARIIVGLSLWISCAAVGIDTGVAIGSWLDRCGPSTVTTAEMKESEPNATEESKPTSATSTWLPTIDATAVAVTAAASVLLLVLVAELWLEQRDTLSVTSSLGPLGACLRYVLSVELKVLYPTFPLGTLAANILGTTLAASLLKCTMRGDVWCANATVGIAGALSTASSFAIDAITLRREDRPAAAYGYIMVSLLVCILIAMGPVLAVDY